MKKQQSGFTLIELVVVIVILGILSAVAVPRFVDLTGDANKAATQGLAGAIVSGDSINYSTYLARRTVSDLSAATSGVVDTSAGCTLGVAQSLLKQPATISTTDYTVTLSGTAGTTSGSVNTCILKHVPSSQTATFTVTVAK